MSGLNKSIGDNIYPLVASEETNRKIREIRFRVRDKLKAIGIKRIYIHKDKDELDAIREWDGDDENPDFKNIKALFIPPGDK